MEQVRHDIAAGESVKRYTSPNVKVVFVKSQGVLCVSPHGENIEKFTIGDDRYGESDWE